ncbi:MAG: DUF4870 domain-containing protein [Planctomycetota bacterium]|jgi:uncharacterized membrane protein
MGSHSTHPSPREKRLAFLAHGSTLLMFFFPLGNVAGPLAFLMTAGRRSAFVASHASQAFLFQGLVSLAAWTLFLFALMHGLGPGAHFFVLLASLTPHLLGAGRALRGLQMDFPLIARWAEGRMGF